MIDLESPSAVYYNGEERLTWSNYCLLICDPLDRITRREHAQRAVCARRATVANQAHGDLRMS